jgi:L-aspartate oxidase
VVLTKTRLSAAGGGGASVWAQGGVASAIGADDDPALHAADTLAAGAGLNDPRIVKLLTGEGPRRVRGLLALGARFDRDAAGRLALGREAAHSRRRILHAHGDATGAEVVRTLVEAVRREPAIQVADRTFALDLALTAGGGVAGVLALDPHGRRVLYRAPAVVLATGGLGQLFLYTTNPREATADGLAMAARAGARLVDLEFVQFHPTALAAGVAGDGGGAAGLAARLGDGAADGAAAPLALLTEALRGEGAVLMDDRGVRFMAEVHRDWELAPRDVVARAIWRRLREGRRVFLDARRAVGARFPERFPTVFALCRRHGLDPRVEPMPVVPAAHYHMGGVAVDAAGRTSLPGLWACGEVAATGAHGANRLASNSLLEALVFGARVAEDVAASAVELGAIAAQSVSGVAVERDRAGGVTAAAELDGVKVPMREQVGAERDAVGLAAADAEIDRIRHLMWEQVGVERDGAGLAAAVEELDAMAARQAETAGPAGGEPAHLLGEARNLLWVARLLTAAALARRESRGGHYRTDYPCPDPAWQHRLFLTATPGGAARFEPGEPQSAATGEPADTAHAAGLAAPVEISEAVETASVAAEATRAATAEATRVAAAPW